MVCAKDWRPSDGVYLEHACSKFTHALPVYVTQAKLTREKTHSINRSNPCLVVVVVVVLKVHTKKSRAGLKLYFGDCSNNKHFAMGPHKNMRLFNPSLLVCLPFARIELATNKRPQAGCLSGRAGCLKVYLNEYSCRASCHRMQNLKCISYTRGNNGHMGDNH